MLAPIVIFAFNRPTSLQRMLNTLKQNPEYENSEKFFFIDGARNPHEQTLVNEVVDIARNESNNVVCNPSNLGLGTNVIKGVSTVLATYSRAIVLEDDLELMPGFLRFMNEGLNQFESDPRILSICGYSLRIKPPKSYSSTIYLSDRTSSWGWATWADRWAKVDWTVSDWQEFSTDTNAVRAFNRAGSDMFAMLKAYMEGKNRSWAIRFCYHQFRHSMWSVHPIKSLVDNNGFGVDATNCRQKYNRFRTDTAPSIPLPLGSRPEPNQQIIRQLHRYHSLPLRLYSRMRKFINL